MSKYLYPIYKSKLKPWIKWWLLKRLSGGSSSLVAVTITSDIHYLRNVDTSKALSIKEYYGNTVQDGTPTPEAPVEIQTITGDNSFQFDNETYTLDLGGKNIFNGGLFASTTQDGLTITNNNDGTLTLNGTWTGTSTWNYTTTPTTLAKPIKNINGVMSIHILSGSYSSSGYPTAFRFELRYTGGNSWVGFSNDQANRFITSDKEYTTPRLQFIYNANNTLTFNNLRIGLQIEEGSTITEYSPYVANPIELCKIGNYVDTIFKAEEGNSKYDSLDSAIKETLTTGNWYIEKNIGKVVLNENSNISKYDNNGRYCIRGILATKGSTTSPNAMSNYFNGVFAIGNGNIFSSGVDGTINMINTSYLNDLDGFKTWLGTTTPIVYYVLATPTYEVITNETLLDQLNTLSEFYVTNSNFYLTVYSDIEFQYLLEYYKKG